MKFELEDIICEEIYKELYIVQDIYIDMLLVMPLNFNSKSSHTMDTISQKSIFITSIFKGEL